VLALHLAQRSHGLAKVQGIHPSFPSFIRIAYAWLAVAGGMGIWAAFADQHGGIWGASRHALTVGFAATMVFSIGPRILPHFAGVRAIFSNTKASFRLRGRCCPSPASWNSAPFSYSRPISLSPSCSATPYLQQMVRTNMLWRSAIQKSTARKQLSLHQMCNSQSEQSFQLDRAY
jgi:hypothetical protein